MRLRYDGCAPAHASSTRFSRLFARAVLCHNHNECSCSCSVFRPCTARFCLNLSPLSRRASARPTLSFIICHLSWLAGTSRRSANIQSTSLSPVAPPQSLRWRRGSCGTPYLRVDLLSLFQPTFTRTIYHYTYGPSPRPLMTPHRSHPHLH